MAFLTPMQCVITLTKESRKSFVHKCYSKEAYMKAHELVMYPFKGKNLRKNLKIWPLLPPEHIKLPSRPKKIRRR